MRESCSDGRPQSHLCPLTSVLRRDLPPLLNWNPHDPPLCPRVVGGPGELSRLRTGKKAPGACPWASSCLRTHLHRPRPLHSILRARRRRSPPLSSSLTTRLPTPCTSHCAPDATSPEPSRRPRAAFARPRCPALRKSLAPPRHPGAARQNPLEDRHRRSFHRGRARRIRCDEALPCALLCRPGAGSPPRRRSRRRNSSRATSPASATPAWTSSRCRASSRAAAASSTSTRPRPIAPSGSNSSATKSNRSANSIPKRSAPPRRLDEARLLPLTETPVTERLLAAVHTRLSGSRIESTDDPELVEEAIAAGGVSVFPGWEFFAGVSGADRHPPRSVPALAPSSSKSPP